MSGSGAGAELPQREVRLNSGVAQHDSALPGYVPNCDSLMDVTIRPARADDLRDLLSLLPQLSSRPTSVAAQMADTERAAEILRRLLEREDLTLLVAEDVEVGSVVGTLTLLLVPNLTYGGRPWSMIENVVVDQRCRGRGIGRRLMDHAMDISRRQGSYKVQLLSGSKQEQVEFYARLGFDSSNCTGHKRYFT
jgi:ribosomal protein S18 acetylase RimI-like enzyme